MGAEVPDYYQSLIEDPDEDSGLMSAADVESERESGASDGSETSPRVYHADAFQLTLPSGNWRDQSTYLLQGPRLDGVTHNVSITVAHDVDAPTVRTFASEQVEGILVSRDESRLLVDDRIMLDCGHPAHRAILSWAPPSGRRLYQEQVYVLHEGRGFALTVSFTRASRKEVGEQVEQVMLGFHPVRDGEYGRD